MATQLLQTTILNEQFLDIDYSKYTSSVEAIHRHFEETKDELAGWLNAPLEDNQDLISSIETIAVEIKENADVLVVIANNRVYRRRVYCFWD